MTLLTMRYLCLNCPHFTFKYYSIHDSLLLLQLILHLLLVSHLVIFLLLMRHKDPFQIHYYFYSSSASLLLPSVSLASFTLITLPSFPLHLTHRVSLQVNLEVLIR